MPLIPKSFRIFANAEARFKLDERATLSRSIETTTRSSRSGEWKQRMPCDWAISMSKHLLHTNSRLPCVTMGTLSEPQSFFKTWISFTYLLPTESPPYVDWLIFFQGTYTYFMGNPIKLELDPQTMSTVGKKQCRKRVIGSPTARFLHYFFWYGRCIPINFHLYSYR